MGKFVYIQVYLYFDPEANVFSVQQGTIPVTLLLDQISFSIIGRSLSAPPPALSSHPALPLPPHLHKLRGSGDASTALSQDEFL